MMGSEIMVKFCLPSESKTNNVDGVLMCMCVSHTTYFESNGVAS